MKEKLNELLQGNKIAIYDKKMAFALAQQLENDMLCCRQDDSCFMVWVANEREQMRAFKKWCDINNYNVTSASAIQEFLKGGGIIWLG